MNLRLPDPFPVDEAMPALSRALSAIGTAVLVAPPGAGKTTRVPLGLLDENWLGGRKIVILEPRRIAARAAANRMAFLHGGSVGETIGLRARLDTRVSTRTRIEVVTEGVFTRMILADPGLDGIGAVIFDEFHERSLDADLGLALALDARAGLRDDLRLLVMSATLAGARVAELLGNTPVIETAGRVFPVETRYLGRNAASRIEEEMAEAITRSLKRDEGSILAFLPGQGEIMRTRDRLLDLLADRDVILAPLYGAMDPAAQDLAISPAPEGKRKVVLATAIAETSITIEDVRIVVDSGLARVPRFEPGAGVTRLETVRAARSSVDQRRGRAGRTAPGICYRLWPEPQTRSLPEFAAPEIRSADLSGLLIDCADWGVADLSTLHWLDQPPAAAIKTARATLISLGALETDGHITPLGRSLRRLPLPPRLAGMVIAAAGRGEAAAQEASEIAALLVERGLGGTATDLTERMERFRQDRSPRARQIRSLAANWTRLAISAANEHRGAAGRLKMRTAPNASASATGAIAAHVAVAFPDRIAKARGNAGQFLLASGRGAYLDPTDPLARAPFLVIAELQGAAASTRILAAVGATEQDILRSAADRIELSRELFFDTAASSVRARRTQYLGAIVLESKPEDLAAHEPAEIQNVLARGLVRLGIRELPWSKSHRQLRERVAFLRASGDAAFPDLSDDALGATAVDWLAPFLAGKSRANEVTADDLELALQALLPWPLRQRLDEEAPTRFIAPTGQSHVIDYQGAGAPTLHIRVQELFGLKQHPAIAGGRLPLTLNLLSPARRPIQITRDLPGFWTGSWSTVKSEMKGRYPKHFWPDDPANAAPTHRAKPRGSK